MPETADSLLKGMTARLDARDRDGAVDLALSAVRDSALSVPELYDMLAELLVGVGESWQRGETPVWQEHFATATVRTIVEACHPFVDEAAAPSVGRTVVLATPPEEYHDLGLRMVADRFELAGWTTHLLGASLPASELSQAVSALGADAVVLSASTHFHRVSLRPYVQALRADHPRVRIWVGGAAFTAGAEDWPAEMLLNPDAIPTLAAQAG